MRDGIDATRIGKLDVHSSRHFGQPRTELFCLADIKWIAAERKRERQTERERFSSGGLIEMAEDAVLALLGRFFQHSQHTLYREEE